MEFTSFSTGPQSALIINLPSDPFVIEAPSSRALTLPVDQISSISAAPLAVQDRGADSAIAETLYRLRELRDRALEELIAAVVTGKRRGGLSFGLGNFYESPDRAERAIDNWQRLVRRALQSGEFRFAAEGRDDLGGFVPTSLGQQSGSINLILQVAEEIQPLNPHVARILCEYAYSMAQQLDPQSEGRGVLQFKTGLMSVIRQKQSKKEGERIDRTQDIIQIQNFYEEYRRFHKIDELERLEQQRGRIREDAGEAERRMHKLRKVSQVSKVLNDVLNSLIENTTEEEREKVISKETKDKLESAAAKTVEFKPFNILPLESPGVPDTIVLIEEVRAAALTLGYSQELPRLPESAVKAGLQRDLDIFDLLEYIFGFQIGNVNNQREHLILLLANSQAALGPPSRANQVDDSAIRRCYGRLLDNYIKWCQYLRIQAVTERATGDPRMMVLLTATYLLIWGEAANLRFLPECLCYIYHHMVKELYKLLDNADGSGVAERSKLNPDGSGTAYLEKVVTPLYQVIAAEAKNSQDGKASHAAWRNYDDFNEYFWSPRCLDSLSWPWRPDAGFMMKPKKKEGNLVVNLRRAKGEKRVGKMTFVEHRTGFHVYHSFHRLWIFFTVMLQALMIFAFAGEKLNARTFKKMLSVGPTFVIMKFIQSLLDIVFIYGAYASTQGWTFSRIISRLAYFGGLSGALTWLYAKMIQEDNSGSRATTWYHLFMIVLGAYLAAQLIVTLIMRIPFLRREAEKCGDWAVIRFVMWVHQDRYFVGRGLYERTRDYVGYTAFWIVVLACKFSFSYYFQIKALVSPTQTIVRITFDYKWHDFISRHNHNALTLAALWAPVILIYYLDTQVWYTVISSLVGGLDGATARLGEIRTVSMFQKRFSSFPDAFAKNLFSSKSGRGEKDPGTLPSQLNWNLQKLNAFKFAPMWNEIITSLREEDYISNSEKDLLLMPRNHGPGALVQWPLFLLANKVYLAVEMAQDSRSLNQQQLWEKVSKDEYMAFAVDEAYKLLEEVLLALVKHDAAHIWVKGVFNDVNAGIQESALQGHFYLKRVDSVLSKVTALTTVLTKKVGPDAEKNKAQAVIAMQDLYEAVMNDFFTVELRERIEEFRALKEARMSGRLFGNLDWPTLDREMENVKRLHLLLTIKESAASIPRNLEARRRLQFFTNSLFMNMPSPPPVLKSLSYSVFTPYYAEDVLYGKEKLKEENEDGITILFYLQKIFPDEWKNFVERQGIVSNEIERQLNNNTNDMMELRLWASYRGQTLVRTVRGMMYYKKALILQSLLEGNPDVEEGGFLGATLEESPGYRMARAIAEIKFTYVVTCQIYGQQKQKNQPQAKDILYLMQKYESLRVAYVDIVDKVQEDKDGKAVNVQEFYSKLIKADADGKDQEIYSIKLPGQFRLGEGKPENQNHAIVFTRGDACQTIDMNQDNYFEESYKMRNLLEEFSSTHCLRSPTILGIREHVFTGSVSSLAWFMSQQETSFVTLGQRVLSRPLKVRMHYGHPDVFDRIFHITRGGISKSSKTINISEDIFAGFNSTLRQGNITHHEYIQVGKGRDVGLNQIAMFEAKVSSGNGEQILSRDVFRLGQLFDFFRMLSFFYTSVGYYITTLMTTLVVYVFLYGKVYLALSGMDRQLQDLADLSGNRALESAINTQFLLQIGIFTAIPMIMNFILEQGVLKAIISFCTMQLQLSSVFFTFSLGTKTHYFGRTVLHGGAKYRATGRGFVVQHISFADNYRLYARSHFIKALEIAMLLITYLSYGQDNSGLAYILLSFSSWFMALSWLFAPYIFNPAGFEWQKTVEDFDNWTNWLFYKGGIGLKDTESWETWWEGEQAHIRTLRGRIWEIILSLRFFFFQYGVVYSLNVAGSSKSLAVYGYSWIAFGAVILFFQIFSFTTSSSVKFQLFLRLFQGGLFLALVASIAVTIVFTDLTIGDCFATLLVFIPTGWGLLSICQAIKPILENLRLWDAVRSGFRLYDAMMGAVIFTPIAVLSWFPFVSTFQTRLVFNQAFSRGLEISLILAGNRPNANT
ncbi:hypothetical protein R1flu_016418 [Riccia fluitans]|uniref:1,3-beta-glucan synthase n=1 Tax=Riccia fluitans TaxID=41844 RepID=A0ABD1YQM9_9MARC